MREAWTRFRERAGAFWAQLSPWQRASIAAGLVGLAGVSIVLALHTAPRGYVPLFTQLAPADAGEIVAALKERGVPYQLAQQGTVVLVPEEAVHEVRLELASEGLPRGGVVGFEIFQDSPIGTTDFERQVRFLQALQGELTRTIRALNEVADARVHIALPERSPFLRNQRPATASVVLHLRAPLQPEQVRGIKHLVARSVENLDPANVTVLDSRGQILSDDEASRTAGIDVRGRLELQRAYERQLEQSVESMLERVFGKGRAVARVRAELDFDLLEERQELFEPVIRDGGILRSQQRLEETWEGGFRGADAGGVPGVEANVPGYAGIQPAQGRGERIEEISNWEVNRTERVRITTPGAVKGLSVAVWIDGDLDPAERQRVEDTVVSALGLDLARGDRVTVESLSFHRAEEPVIGARLERRWFEEGPWPWLVFLAISLLVIAMFALILQRRAKPADAGKQVDVKVGDEGPALAMPELPPEEQLRLRRQEAIERMARQRPEDIARVVRTWLAEDEL